MTPLKDGLVSPLSRVLLVQGRESNQVRRETRLEMHTLAMHTLRTLGIAGLLIASAGCGGDDNPYKPTPAWSGKKASLPAPAALATTPIKAGDSYTVYGAIHQLRSLLHGKDVTANPISITGYVIDSNVGRAPECAIHKTGKADPDKCTPEVPSFWIADEKGNITNLFPAYAAAVAFERHEWYQRLDFQMALLAATALLFASAIVIWPVIAFSMRGLTAPTIRRTRVSGLATFIGFLLSAACLAVLIGVLIGLQEPDEVAFGTPPTLKWVLAIPQVCVALTALALVFCLVSWKQRYWRFSGRLHYTLVTLAGVGFCWFTYYWNLLHFGSVSV